MGSVKRRLARFHFNDSPDRAAWLVSPSYKPDADRVAAASAGTQELPDPGAQPDARVVRSKSVTASTTETATGTVKWLNLTKGCGFVQPSGGGRGVFVRISAVERAGRPQLAKRGTSRRRVRD